MPPLLMGILNVTPDSFSDGGRYVDLERGLDHARQMAADGADWIDVGGESTRPGADPVPVEEELRRILPVVGRLSSEGLRVSIDTRKPDVAREALAAGARMVNDVGGMRLPAMRSVCAGAECSVCLMHMQGEPATMQAAPIYGDVVEEVRAELLGCAARCVAEGIDRSRLWIDPGIGFGKTLEHNLLLLRRLDRLVNTGLPVLVGVSRKAFIGRLTGGAPTDDRLEGTLAAQVLAQAAGARMIRAHDVRSAARAMSVAAEILG